MKSISTPTIITIGIAIIFMATTTSLIQTGSFKALAPLLISVVVLALYYYFWTKIESYLQTRAQSWVGVRGSIGQLRRLVMAIEAIIGSVWVFILFVPLPFAGSLLLAILKSPDKTSPNAEIWIALGTIFTIILLIANFYSLKWKIYESGQQKFRMWGYRARATLYVLIVVLVLLDLFNLLPPIQF